VKLAYSHKGREKIQRGAASDSVSERGRTSARSAGGSKRLAATRGKDSVGEDKNRSARSFTSATFVQDGNEK
jgi:hypothetical protein